MTLVYPILEGEAINKREKNAGRAWTPSNNDYKDWTPVVIRMLESFHDGNLRDKFDEANCDLNLWRDTTYRLPTYLVEAILRSGAEIEVIEGKRSDMPRQRQGPGSGWRK